MKVSYPVHIKSNSSKTGDRKSF
uniref:Uncharacterized protein n=1 Tax=Anguilla anguilla TaxID=7936 RepID=A0A0E9TN28_ANGAN